MAVESARLFPVALARCEAYGDVTKEAVCAALDASGLRPAPGEKILVKPNLLRADALSCTTPQVVAAACEWLLAWGARVRVADSPGFGTAQGVAARIGLAPLLRPLGLTVEAMRSPVPVRLPDGRSWGVARIALESDRILSIPRVKAHSQLGLTLAVKNLFGCVCGLRKALAHSVQGHVPGLFEACLAELWTRLPPSAGLADGVVAMHRTGPSGGDGFALGCIGASVDAAALDTALYELLGATARQAPLWQALRERSAAQAFAASLSWTLLQPADFAARGFTLPAQLLDMSFRPHRLAKSFCKRLWHSLRG